MSKGSEWAKRAPKELHLEQSGSEYSSCVFPVIEDGEVMMRIDNAGPFTAEESLRLAQWIHDTFGEPPARPTRRAKRARS